MEFEESGELQKVYLQREDHVETRSVSHGKTPKNLTASPGDPLSSAPAALADASTTKPEAEQETQASDNGTIEYNINCELESGYL